MNTETFTARSVDQQQGAKSGPCSHPPPTLNTSKQIIYRKMYYESLKSVHKEAKPLEDLMIRKPKTPNALNH